MKRSPDKKKPETIDAKTGKPEDSPPVKPPRRIDLSGLRDVRLEMADLYRRMDAGEIDSGEANRRVWHLERIGNILVVSELERRIQELEDQTARHAIPGQRALPERTLN